MTDGDVSDVRESMVALSEGLPRVLHEWGQHLLTWFTGRPLPGQTPWHRSTPNQQILAAVVWLFAGAFGGYFLLTATTMLWPLLPVAWLCVVSSARRLQVSIFHVTVHAAFTGNKRADRLIGELISVVLFISPYDHYYFEHVVLHHPVETFGTIKDPDLAFLVMLGFKPGMTKRELWQRLLATVFSPKFHLLFFAARLKANFVGSRGRPTSRARLAAAYVFNAGLLAAVAYANLWYAFLLCWFFPLTLLYHVSAILQFVCEHRWLLKRLPDEPAKMYVSRMTVGRFLGSRFPAKGGLAAKGLWSLKMLGHGLSRVAVMVNGLPEHDWHHRHPRSKEWPNSVYARQFDNDSGHKGWPEEYQEVWGLFTAIDTVFDQLSSLPPEAASDEPEPRGAVGFPSAM